MNIGIIGCGAVGIKRSKLLGNNILKAVADCDILKAYSLASDNIGVKVFSDYKELLKLPEIDAVVVSTINNMLVPITSEAIKHNKHVLVEKPCGTNAKEIFELIEIYKKHNVKVKIGYNLKNHIGLLKSKDLIDSGIIGDLMFIRGHYGNGSRLGFEKEWRTNPTISGGGCVLDLGVHLIELSQYFLGDLHLKSSSIKTYFWNIKVEDTAFMTLENISGKTTFLSVSSCEWKNTFSFEIYGKIGKIKIEGLGGSYGTERVTLYKMLPQMGAPETTIWEYPFEDESWKTEIEDLIKDIEENRETHTNLEDGYKILKIIDEIYKNNQVK